MRILWIPELALFIALYCLGGQKGPRFKKWFGPAVLAGAVIGNALLFRCFTWWTLGALLYFAAANLFDYGVKVTKDILWRKILFRGLCGAAYGLTALVFSFPGHLVLGILQMVIAAAASAFFGAFNPYSKKVPGNWATILEDFSISLSYVLLLPFIVS